MTLSDRIHFTAVVMSTGGVVLGSLWVVASIIVLLSRKARA